jgi:predicted DNA-binding protein
MGVRFTYKSKVKPMAMVLAAIEAYICSAADYKLAGRILKALQGNGLRHPKE